MSFTEWDGRIILSMKSVNEQIRACYNCDLRKTCKGPVAGAGTFDPSVLFVGEAPGADEDDQGIPFMGVSGQLLRTLVEQAGIELSYYTNAIKCRPPKNRDPSNPELRACLHHLDAEINALNPRVIVTVGRIAMTRFLPDDLITKVRGVPKVVHGRVVLPIIHTAAALRRPEFLPLIKADLALVSRILDTPLESSDRYTLTHL